jgi:hypothetical protein
MMDAFASCGHSKFSVAFLLVEVDNSWLFGFPLP